LLCGFQRFLTFLFHVFSVHNAQSQDATVEEEEIDEDIYGHGHLLDEEK